MDNQTLVLADAEGVIQLWSAGAERAFGHAACDAVGQTLDLIVPPDLREQHWIGFRRAMATAQAAVEGQPGPFPVLRADGAIAETLGRLTLLRDPKGAAIGAAVAFE